MLYEAGHWIYNWIIGWGGIGALVSIALWAAWYFSPLAKPQLLHAAVTVTGITLASTYMSAHYFNQGYQVAINQVAAKNQGATNAVKKATSSVDDCNNSGGTWDTVSGVCGHE